MPATANVGRNVVLEECEEVYEGLSRDTRAAVGC